MHNLDGPPMRVVVVVAVCAKDRDKFIDVRGVALGLGVNANASEL